MNIDRNTEEIILDFFNGVQNPAEITLIIKDAPDYGERSPRAYGIRPKLAERIIATRNSLRHQKFQSIKDIDDVYGVGEDTLQDIVYSFTEGLLLLTGRHFTEADFKQGWYYGQLNQKKRGTPAYWRHTAGGTKSAKWIDPKHVLQG